MATEIAPSILAENSQMYKEQIDRVQAFADRIHIDIADGEFAPTFTIGLNEVWWPQGWVADIHAMVMRPEEHMQTMLALKPSLIILHAEAQGDVLGCLRQIQAAGIRAGIALLKPTVPNVVADLIKQAEHVMVFTGELGKFGGQASMMQLEKVRLIRAINPDVEIGWDGGVNIDNTYTLTQGGVNVLNVGGTIHKAEDAQVAYAKLVAETQKQGVL